MPRLQLLGRFLPRSLAGLAVLLVSTVPAIAAAGPSAAQLQALETALNGTGELRGAMEDGPGLDVTLVELRRRSVLRQFPDARWQLTTGKPLRDGRSTVQLQVTGTRQEGPTRYRLDAQQQLVLSSSGGPGGRINGQIVIREQTLMRSGEADLPVSLLIPDAVLTGQRYDVDALFDEPLEGAIAAGGLVALTGQQVNALESPELQLGALGGGGLFKSVQAPFTPGSQTWAILLVHPKGIVSATKRVLVVADKTQLDP
ncbi:MULTISPECIES: hypothetical protein [unclassified Cyanobium]|uniref:hypothetical protein n=1 Tax=unclassified Cyanobium TaxID=2627006 RepID=UPI0020CB7717|nr:MULTISPECIES: hypothetical protein [unclassified Cyanobium]